MSGFAALSFVNFTLCLLLGVAVYSLNPKDRLNKAFVVLCAFWAMYAFTEFHYRSAESFARSDTWLFVEKFLWPLAIAAILHFALMFSEYTRFLSRKIAYAVIYGPAIAVSLVDSSTRLITKAPEKYWWGWAAPSNDESWLFWAAFLWASAAATAAVVVCFRNWRRTISSPKRDQARMIFLMIAAPVAFGILQELWATMSPHVPELVTISGAWMAVVISYAILRYDLFIVSPEKVADRIISSVSDSLVLLGHTGHIVMVNKATLEMLSYTEERELIGRPVEDILDGWASEELSPREFRPGAPLDNVEASYKRSNGDLVPVILSSSNVTDRFGNAVGSVLIAKDISERKHADAVIKHLAYFDSLTGLPNRALFTDRLSQALAASERTGEMVAVLALDIEGFSHVNDALGRHIGDLLLKGVAERLISHLRESDTVARFGNDEFAIIQSGLRDFDQAGTLARKCIEVLAEPFAFEGREVTVSLNIGISVFPYDSIDPEQLIQHADMSMYWAKAQASDYLYFDKEMDAQAQNRLMIESGLRRAIDNDEFILEYQPVTDLHSGRIVGSEALVRWAHPKRGIILPGEFIEIAESGGQIIAISEWVLRAACRQIREWGEAGLALPVSVNVSGQQLTHPSFLQTVASVLEETQVDPSLVKFELTESALMEEVGEAAIVIGELIKLGIGFYLDDFGTGYSSLSYLRWLPVEVLKIDRSFLQDLSADSSNAAIVNAAITLAHALGMTVVAEGVETPAHIALLQEMGCDLAQGYFFGRPTPPEDFFAIVTAQDSKRGNVA